MSENFVPSFVEHVTDDLVDEMIVSGKWVEHGGDLEDQWTGGVFDYELESTYPELIGKDFEEVRNLPQFRQILKTMLLSVAEENYNNLVNGSKFDNLPPLTPDSLIYRGITLKGGLNGTTGIYWSQLKSQALYRFIDENTGGWLFVSRAGDVTIDWYQTIRSRLDLAHGQDEVEIQLVKGSPVKARVYRVHFIKGKPQITLGNYHFLRA